MFLLLYHFSKYYLSKNHLHSPDCQETEAKCSGICFILPPPARSYEKKEPMFRALFLRFFGECLSVFQTYVFSFMETFPVVGG